MQDHYENDVETLLERSIDENYSKQKNDENKNKWSKCPFNNYSKNADRPTNNFRNKKLSRVQETSKFNRMLLPEGWIRLFHDSGMFFYCHVATKVVTWSMPYEILTEPARYHRVPVRSIPCLSILSQKCDNTDWDKLVKPSEAKEKKPDHICEKINHETTVQEFPPVIDKLNEPDKDKVMESQERKEIKEEGEIESSDENGSEELSNSHDTKEPALPKQYQLNHDKHKHPRSRTVSLIDAGVTKRKLNIDELDSTKRRRISSDTPLSNSTKEIQNAQETMTESPTVEQLDLTSRLLEPQEFHKYCEKIFTFVDEIKYVPRFNFNRKKLQGAQKNKEIPEPEKKVSVAEITVPLNCTLKIKIPNKNLFLDVAGRTYPTILNMYCQQAYCVTPTFKFSSSISGIHDFEVTCDINQSIYGVGEGRTKKGAKNKAIIKTLEILIPGFLQKISDFTEKSQPAEGELAGPSQVTSSSGTDATDDIYSLFDIMEITDPRVYNFTMKLNTTSPYNVLTECINRHCVSDNEIKCKIVKQDNHNVFKLVIGDKEVETKCDNKREGRHLAAQYMLAKLHPHIQSWGGILRLYGPGSKPVKRFDMQELQNLLLEDRGGVKNNLINLLRKKMLDLNEEYQGSADKSKAKFKTPFHNFPVIVFHPDSKPPSGSQ